MPACARREIVREGEVGVYHVYNRCVRRAFLCGEDELTGKDYNHRRDWIIGMERELAQLFAIDISYHAELSNHLHLILRTRPDLVEIWSAEELARRWLTINRLVHSKDGHRVRPVTDEEVAVELAKEEDRARVLRKRLASVSEFMKALCEHISRRANREEKNRGTFWEKRFGCRNLAGQSAILLCGVYVDLNQIRAGEALTPEESTHTSVFDRIQGRLQRHKPAPLNAPFRAAAVQVVPADGFLCELSVDERAEAYEGPQLSKTPWRASDKGLLPIRLDEYLELLDWTGRMVSAKKKGAIPSHLAPILQRLRINESLWLDLVEKFDDLFSHVVGTATQLTERAAKVGRRWYQGRAACAEAFG